MKSEILLLSSDFLYLRSGTLKLLHYSNYSCHSRSVITCFEKFNTNNRMKRSACPRKENDSSRWILEFTGFDCNRCENFVSHSFCLRFEPAQYVQGNAVQWNLQSSARSPSTPSNECLSEPKLFEA